MERQELLNWASIHNVSERSRIHFKEYINNYINECSDYNTKILTLMDFNYLTYEDWSVSFAVIFLADIRNSFSFALDLYYCKQYIGKFRVFFSEDGEISDESLELEKAPWVRRFCNKMKKTNFNNNQ
jgi:hypothetical protein